jgi:hypothetical protein
MHVHVPCSMLTCPCSTFHAHTHEHHNDNANFVIACMFHFAMVVNVVSPGILARAVAPTCRLTPRQLTRVITTTRRCCFVLRKSTVVIAPSQRRRTSAQSCPPCWGGFLGRLHTAPIRCATQSLDDPFRRVLDRGVHVVLLCEHDMSERNADTHRHTDTHTNTHTNTHTHTHTHTMLHCKLTAAFNRWWWWW